MRKIKINILITKTILYRIFRTLTNICLFGYFYMSWKEAFKISMILVLFSTIGYFIFELIFDSLIKIGKDNE